MRSNLLSNPRGMTVLAVCLAIPGLGACGDDPFEVRWSADVDTVELFSLSRPELNLGSAYNFDQRRVVVVEAPGATGTWDVAVDDDGTEMFLVPPAALGIESRAGIAPIQGVSFESVTEAPSDTTLYVSDEFVPVRAGTIYVVRTSESVGFFGQRCVYYGKLEPVEIDLDRLTLTFRFDASPVCNDRSLIPTDEESD